jgi:hypothetical protein
MDTTTNHRVSHCSDCGKNFDNDEERRICALHDCFAWSCITCVNATDKFLASNPLIRACKEISLDQGYTRKDAHFCKECLGLIGKVIASENAI